MMRIFLKVGIFVVLNFIAVSFSHCDTVSDTFYVSGSFGIRGIAVDNDGNVILADMPDFLQGNIPAHGKEGSMHVLVYDKDGVKIGDLITAGIAYVRDVSFDREARIYVAEGYMNGRIGIYDRSGRLIKSLGGHGTGPGQFPGNVGGREDLNSPYSVAVGNDGSVYALEACFVNKVYRYDSKGIYRGTIDCPDTQTGEFKFPPYDYQPRKVRVNPKNNNLCVLEERGIYIFDSTGKFIRKLPGKKLYIAFDSDGNIITENEGWLCLFDEQGNVKKQILQLNFQVQDITGGPDGKLYIVPVSKEIAYKVYSAEGDLVFEQNADFKKVEVTLSYDQLDSGEKVPVLIKVTERSGGTVTGQESKETASKMTSDVVQVFLREYGGKSPWRNISMVQGSKPNYYILQIPDDLWGAYTIRFVTTTEPEPVIKKGPQVDFIVGISPQDGIGSLTIFTDRNRNVYKCGEDIELNLTLRTGKGMKDKQADISISMVSEGSTIWTNQLLIDSFSHQTKTFTYVIPGEVTRFLKPQTYTVSAEAQGVKLKKGFKELVLTSGIIETKFQKINHNIFVFGEDDSKKVAFLGKLGFNRMIFYCFNPMPISSYNKSVSRILFANRKLPVVEEAYVKSDIEVSMENGLLYGLNIRRQPFVHFAVFPFLSEDQPMVQSHLQRLAQGMGRYPNLLGFNYHDMIHPFQNDNARYPKAVADFEKQFDMKPPTPGECSLVRSNKGTEEIWEKVLTWTDYLTGIYPKTYVQWNKAVKDVHPGLQTTVSPYMEHLLAGTGSYQPKIQEPMDEVVSNYVEEQYYEIFHLPHQVDYFRRPNKPIISVGASSYQDTGDGQSSLREYFLTLGRGVQGAGYGTTPRYDQYIYKVINQLLTNYGDFLYGLKPHNEIAILYSYTQSAFDIGLGHSEIQWEKVFGAYSGCLLAHYPATIIYEEDLRTGRAKDYKVIIVVGVQVALSEEVKNRLEEFTKSGGIVLTDKDTGQIIKNQVSMPLSFGWHRTRQGMSFQWSDAKHFLTEESILPKIPVIKEYLSRYVAPFADCDNTQVFLSEQRYDRARYLFVANATRLPHRPQDLWRFASFETTGLPAREKLKVKNGDEIIYDLFSGKEVQPDMKDGVRTVTADMTILPGRIFAFLPERISSISVETSEVRKGNSLTYRVLILDSKGKPIAGLIPVEITIKDSNGRVRYRLYRAVDAKGWKEELPVAFNDIIGSWSIEVTELFSGITSQVNFQVNQEETKFQIVQSPEVMVFGRENIQKLLRNNSGEIALVMDGLQKEHIGSLTERLIQELTVKGFICKTITSSDYIKDTGPTFRNDGIYQEVTGEQKSLPKWAGVLTLGMPDKENQLLDKIKNQLNTAPRNFTENYPGKDRGLIQYVFAPCRYKEDAIILYGGDITGLEKAVDKFLAVIDQKIETPDRLTQSEVGNNLKMQGDKKESKKELNPISESFGIPFWQIAVSHDGEQIALGAHAWGNNLFVIDKSGKLLWKTMAGKWYPMEIMFTEGGQVGAVVRENDSTATYLTIFGYEGKIVRQIPAKTRRHFGTRDASVDRLDIVNPVLKQGSNDFSFSVSSDGKRIASAGNLGVEVLDNSGENIWKEEFWLTYKTYNDLLNKDIAKVALSPDGQKISILKQKEHMKMSGVDSAPIELTVREIPSGKVVWAHTFPPKQNFIGKILFFDGIRTVVYLSPNHIYAFEGREQKWKCVAPPGVNKIAVSGNGDFLAIGTEDGIVSIMKGSEIITGTQVSAGVTGLAFTPDNSKLAVGTIDGQLTMIAIDGKIYWQKELDSRTIVAFSPKSDYIVTGDWQGNVRRFNIEGKEEWRINLTHEAWRDDLGTLLIKSDLKKSEASTIPVKLPEGKSNLAQQATIQINIPSGWGSEGKVEHPKEVLNNGKKDDIEKPWLNINEQYWSAGAGRIPSFTFWWPGIPQKVSTIVVYEHSKHPEAVPAECLIEVWKDEKWEPVKVEMFNSGVTHVHSFPEVTTTKLRYSIFADLYQNLWTTEIEVY